MVWSTIYDVVSEKSFYHCAPPSQIIAANATNYLDHCIDLDINSQPALVRLTGIACSIGPASKDPEILEKMMEAGMNIARVNLSYGNRENHSELVKNIRIAADHYSKKLGTTFPLAIAMDTKGPEIRIGYFEGGLSAKVKLEVGDQIKLTTDKAYYKKGSASIVYVDYDIQKLVQLGSEIYIDDGTIILICTSIQGSVWTCIVEQGGALSSYKAVNIPGVEVDLPSITQKDKDDIAFAVELGIDILFVSFVRYASIVDEIRTILGPKGSKIMVISFIEDKQGIKNLDEIIKASDGIGIARGDLGVELPLEKLFLVQKSITARCNRAGKPVVCVKRFLSSMKFKPLPTRAECTDVANAVIDGADCFLLAAVTSVGQYPVETIAALSAICKEAEAAIWTKRNFTETVGKIRPPLEPAHAIAIAAVEASFKCMAAAIIVITTTGHSSFLVARYRPRCPIVTVTRDPTTARKSHTYRAVLPLFYNLTLIDDFEKDLEARINYGISFGKWKGFIRAGDPVIAITGSRRGSGFTDTLRVLYVSRPNLDKELCTYADKETSIVGQC